MTIDFKGKDILNGFQFSNQELNVIMETASYYEMRVKRGEIIKDLEGLVVATLFFEPSTRTRLSFEAAINRLGARVASMAEPANSSIAKGESLEDTILTVDSYCDCIVMRHPVSGSAARAAEVAVHPVINGGDGTCSTPRKHCLTYTRFARKKGI